MTKLLCLSEWLLVTLVEGFRFVLLPFCVEHPSNARLTYFVFRSTITATTHTNALTFIVAAPVSLTLIPSDKHIATRGGIAHVLDVCAPELADCTHACIG